MLAAGQIARGFCGLCDAEVDDLRQRISVDFHDENIRGLQIAVNDAFLCACCTAAAAFSMSRPLALSRGGRKRNSGSPSSYSMTKYGRPAGVAPASKTWAMFG